MRLAFVLQLGSDTDTAARELRGWIEEVDTGREMRFRSTDELMAFLSESFDLARDRDREPRERDDKL
jgi:hypothetical protein